MYLALQNDLSARCWGGGAGGWQTDAHRWLPFSPKSTIHPLSQPFVFIYYYTVAFLWLNSFFLPLLLANSSNHNLNSKTFINRIYPKHTSGKLPSHISISEGFRGVYEEGLSSFSPSLTSHNKRSYYMHCWHVLIALMLLFSHPQFWLIFFNGLDSTLFLPPIFPWKSAKETSPYNTEGEFSKSCIFLYMLEKTGRYQHILSWPMSAQFQWHSHSLYVVLQNISTYYIQQTTSASHIFSVNIRQYFMLVLNVFSILCISSFPAYAHSPISLVHSELSKKTTR